eukprot:8281428-Lingulodinium_polyedra.AAC.1
MLWLAGHLKRACALPSTATVFFDQCGYGTKWRKRTRLQGWHTGSLDHLRRLCQGRRGQCSFTQCPHV